jgi:hypothetical protein
MVAMLLGDGGSASFYYPMMCGDWSGMGRETLQHEGLVDNEVDMFTRCIRKGLHGFKGYKKIVT